MDARRLRVKLTGLFGLKERSTEKLDVTSQSNSLTMPRAQIDENNRSDNRMISSDTKIVSINAKQLYESQLREHLERTALGCYVAIEPESGDYFLAPTFDEAVNRALDHYPDRLTHTIRIGHRAALHLGAMKR